MKQTKKEFKQLPETLWIENLIQNSGYGSTKAAILRKIEVLSHKEGKPYCHMSQKKLAKNCNMSERNLRYHLRDLQADGTVWVGLHAGHKGQNHYQVCPDGLQGGLYGKENRWNHRKKDGTKIYKKVKPEQAATQLVATVMMAFFGAPKPAVNATTVVANATTLVAGEQEHVFLCGQEQVRNSQAHVFLGGQEHVCRQIECEKSIQVLSNNRRLANSPSDINNSHSQNQKPQNQEPANQNPFESDSIAFLMFEALQGRGSINKAEGQTLPLIISPDAPPAAPVPFVGAASPSNVDRDAGIVGSQINPILEEWLHSITA